MRNEFKTKLLNLRPKDRLNQIAVYDGINDTSVAEFVMNKPIHIKSEGHVALKTAFVPITYKNVILNYNDRFILQLFPTTTSGDSDCVFITVQIPQGQYDTATALAAAVNTVLGGLDATCGITDDGGGVLNSYNVSDTAAILSGNLTCSVDTTAKNKHHFKITIPDGVKFASATIKTKDGGVNGESAALLGMQIIFGLSDNGGAGGNEVAGANSEGRSAHKLLGFGDELSLPIPSGGVNYYQVYPNPLQTRTGTAVYTFSSPTLMNVLFTPYIYVRCSLITDSIETVPQGSKISNLLAKIAVSSSGYGDALFYEANDNGVAFSLPPQSIQNLTIHLTDADGKVLPLQESNWEMLLAISGEFDF